MTPPPKPKAPRSPPEPLFCEPDDIIAYSDVLWRVHRTQGEHVLAWNALRHYGPLPSMRWDPHPGSTPATHAEGVLYAAVDVATAVAEVYQTTRTIDTRAGAPRLTAWQPVRPLRLLDLSGTWLIRNNASASLLTVPRSTCRRWACAIHTAWPDLDGLIAPSAMTGRPTVVLWNGAADAMPSAPSFSRALADPMVWSIARAAAITIGYRIR